MIKVEQLSKSFGQLQAVNNVSFEAQDGRITGLLGPNGVGKSTTFRILYTVFEPGVGSVLIDGINISKDPLEARQHIGVLPHDAGLYQNLTAKENISYYGQLYGLSKKQIEARVNELIELLDIGEFANQRAKGFSQGQRIKVALARALIHKPQNVILDEPTNGLDVMSTRALREYIKRLRDDGTCVLFSSHIMQEIAALCDDIIILNHGNVVVSGTPDKIRKHTGNENLEDAFVSILGDEEGME